MPEDSLSRRTLIFVNIAHAFDHFVLLIYPTAVIAIAAEWGLDYASLIRLATGAFLAFGLFSLPMGWLADRLGRRNMLATFFLGYGACCLGMTRAGTPFSIAAWLLALGVFSAIYHPIGSAMLVTHARHLGRDLGTNGVCGNLGAASASAVTAALTAALGWRAAFALPGVACMLCGVAFLSAVRGDGHPTPRSVDARSASYPGRPIAMLVVFAVAIVAGGMTFNITTISMPKVIDERLGLDLPLAWIGSLATVVFIFGALTQLAVGRLVDRHGLPTLFVALATLQPIGLGVAATTSGVPLLLGLFLVTAAIYGQVVVNDAMVARYVPAGFRAKAFGVRYFLGFTASGFAAQIVAWLHARGGFSAVLSTTAAFGAIVLACALLFKALADGPPSRRAAPAE